MASSHQASAKCRELSPQQTDIMFFPGSGGKPTKAKAYCDTCPLIKTCLHEAIELGLDGFFAGTTPDERRIMAEFYHTPTRSINDIVLLHLPKNVGRRKIYKKIQEPKPDTLDYLSTLSGPVL